MNAEFFEALDLLEKEKGIPKSHMLDKVRAALEVAIKRDYNSPHENISINIDENKKEVTVNILKKVVEQVENPDAEISLDDAKAINKRLELGDNAEIEVKTRNFGRISAQTAKQVIIQGIREAERGRMIKEYENKKEEIITATVMRVDETTGNATVDTGTSVATLIKSEQIPGETYSDNEKIKVFVTEVRKESHGPLVTLSRTHHGLVKRLLELEIPEIQDGTVIIKELQAPGRKRMSAADYLRGKRV